MDWNEERTAALKQMWLEGMSASQVARQLGGVSRNAVIGKVHRLGLTSREVPSRPRSLGGRPPGQSSARTRAAATHVRRATATLPQAPAPRPAAPRVPVRAFETEVSPMASMLTLTLEACRWPIGDPGEAGFGFCGRLRGSHASYCDGHAQNAQRRRRSEAAVSAELEYWMQQSSRFNAGAPPSPTVR